jgi:hypothetical protein
VEVGYLPVPNPVDDRDLPTEEVHVPAARALTVEEEVEKTASVVLLLAGVLVSGKKPTPEHGEAHEPPVSHHPFLFLVVERTQAGAYGSISQVGRAGRGAALRPDSRRYAC